MLVAKILFSTWCLECALMLAHWIRTVDIQGAR